MKILLILIVFISNFSMSQEVQDSCKENLRFKKYFFKNISTVKEYGKVGEKWVSKALDQINLYVEVGDFEILGFGGIRYNSDEICDELISKYIDWYKQNKCRNLKRHRRRYYRDDYEPIR